MYIVFFSFIAFLLLLFLSLLLLFSNKTVNDEHIINITKIYYTHMELKLRDKLTTCQIQTHTRITYFIIQI